MGDSTITDADAQAMASQLLGDGAWRATRFGDGRFSDVFAVDRDDEGTGYVLRVAPPDRVLQTFYEYRMMRREPALHARLLADTDVPVPPILAHDFSRRTFARDFLVMPRLPGLPLSQAGLTPGASQVAHRAWGRHVRRIHDLNEPANRFGYLGGDPCMEPQSSWRDAFTIMFAKLLDDIAGCEVYDAGTVKRGMALVTRHAACLDAGTAHLCHGDLWITNLLVQPDGGVTGVIDFDRACWGDAEWDLAIADYCGVTTPDFWEGYGGRVDRRGGPAATRRALYLLYEHQKYIVIRLSTRGNDPSGARRYARECLAMMDALEGA